MRRTYTCAAAVILQGDKARSRLGKPVEPAAYLAAAAGDGEPMGFFFDESQTDEEHEAAIGQIRSYTGQNPFPVMAGGRIRRLEDVKKYLYAGAAAVFFREDDEGEMEIYREAVSRFGAGRTALYDPLTQTVAEEWEDFPEFAQLKKGADGLVPCIVQDVHSGQVLMMAYMNEEAYRRTLDTGRMTYFSRSRQCLWLKGETSGHFQYLRSLYADCDWDTLLARVAQVGAACHTGSYSCFFRPVWQREENGHTSQAVFEELEKVIADRRLHPKEGSYTNYLFEKGIDKILKKVGEEATELVIAAKNSDPEEVKYEAADLLYHMMVLLAEKGVSWKEITEELEKR